MSALRSSLLIATLASLTASAALAQDAPPLLQQMAGTWAVQQRMWPAPGAKVIELPAALARRELVDGKYLEEVMEPAGADGAQAFRRHALLNYNAVSRRYEYTSLDTRAPQLMTEIGAPLRSTDLGTQGLKLQGGRFVAPAWGDAKNVPFTYRLTLGPVRDDRQTVQLYLTPQAVLSKQEFLAFEYVYTRRPR
jgi:hypothetical protein